ncbi:MAG: HDIG domain-containing metalloprotein [Pseudomonadota bacterium]
MKANKLIDQPNNDGEANFPWRWFLTLVVAGILFWGDKVIEYSFSRGVPAKGSIAPFTIRATQDAVFDLHETHIAEAKEAQQSYIPIYNRDDDLFEKSMIQIINSALSLPLDHWGWIISFDGGTKVIDGAEENSISDGSMGASGDDGVNQRLIQNNSVGSSKDQDASVLLNGQADSNDHRHELEKLLNMCFKLVKGNYQAGVVADNEFPNEKKMIRVFSSGKYMLQPVSNLVRFSDLHQVFDDNAQDFSKVDTRIVAQVIEYVLVRLVPNLAYAAENKMFVANISQVTGIEVVPIRRGDVLVSRGEEVGSRAHFAVRASTVAAEKTSALEKGIGVFSLLVALLVIFVVAAVEICPRAFSRIRSFLLVYGGIVVLMLSGSVSLFFWSHYPSLVPQAAVALVVAVVLGRTPGMLTALTVAGCMAMILLFDLSTVIVAGCGGLAGASVIRIRRRAAVLAGGVLVGLVQAVGHEAFRAAEGIPQTADQIWSAGQAFGGGVFAGIVALITLPFVQSWFGQTSRGKLKALSNIDFPLIKRLREQSPDIFAHTMMVVDLADRAAKVVGADRLFIRAGAFFHDLGAMEITEPDEDLAPVERANIYIEQRAASVRLAKEHNLPTELVAVLAEYRGTMEMSELLAEALRTDSRTKAESFRFPGPKPQSVEAAIVMIACQVALRLRRTNNAVLDTKVNEVIAELVNQGQFDECPLSQRQMRKIIDVLAKVQPSQSNLT